jgi:hypothetical protein
MKMLMNLVRNTAQTITMSVTSESSQRPRRQPKVSVDERYMPEQHPADRSASRSRRQDPATQLNDAKRRFDQILKAKEVELDKIRLRNQDLEAYSQQMQNELAHLEAVSERKIAEAHLEKNKIEEEYNSFVRRKQEESFRQMESARWVVPEGKKAIEELDRLKRQIRNAAKGIATKDLFKIKQMSPEDRSALMIAFSDVCVLKNGSLPEELTSAKSPALLLNAMIAHNIYTTLFRNPFFFTRTGIGKEPTIGNLDRILEDIFLRMVHGMSTRGSSRCVKS